MTVGKKIRMKRVAKDLQVKELAERVGVTLQHMSAVENGRKTASLKLLRKVAKELDCSVLDFIEEQIHGLDNINTINTCDNSYGYRYDNVMNKK